MYYTTGTFDYNFYNEYLKNNMSKKSARLVEKIWTSISESSDKQVDYICFQFGNPNGYMYSELILLDICDSNNLYLPVFVENINTSSPYALARLYYDDDDNNNYDNDDNDNYDNDDNDDNICSDKKSNNMNVDSILNLIIEGFDKEKVKSIINKFIELSEKKY